MAYKPISGTFLDVVATRIPGSNWTREVWKNEFARYQRDGIREAYVVRVGHKDSAAFPSRVLKPTLVPAQDTVQLLLDLGQEFGVRIFLGLYDSDFYWHSNDWKGEAAVNVELIHELWERYGTHPALGGWYMNHDGGMHYHLPRIWNPLCDAIRKLDPVRPIMAAPFYPGSKWDGEFPVSPEIFRKHLAGILDEMEGKINIFAPRDGTVAYDQLEHYLRVTAEVVQGAGVQFWSTLEVFDRDMPWKYAPIEFAKLIYKLDAAQKYASRIIAFELPHYMSENAFFSSGKNLYDLYRQYIAEKR